MSGLRSRPAERIFYREHAEAAPVLEIFRYQAFRADLDGCLDDQRVPEGEGVLFLPWGFKSVSQESPVADHVPRSLTWMHFCRSDTYSPSQQAQARYRSISALWLIEQCGVMGSISDTLGYRQNCWSHTDRTGPVTVPDYAAEP